MAKKKGRSEKTKRGPKPKTLKIEDDWKDAVKTALERGKPPRGVAAINRYPLSRSIPRANTPAAH